MDTLNDLLSEEELAIISRLTDQQLEKIDATLLSQVTNMNRKVAMVVGLAMVELSEQKLVIPDIFYGQRVKQLVEKGLLVGYGDLDRMRYSEVKLP